ncbi:putative cytokinetic ring protein SteA [Stackebrandtia nassauensis]|uniref:Thiamin pyrophosphokinase catalytic region n=1 Tax=Stackebrandtia nassauensis (strain DSM 44728 / CIP 108903 / NRRL B-16338 / NBRC 102104 / LLR-40K-21) TaxID=446470 RepID=D3Q532_STANL|nr:putative cytokinetic ring protein SteA [Stackebrandtia nassauensis]ADD44081.1 Thiamin pyrophosphokinase catalytic region [Stackebrandtia nassauensis DSM 44728]
MRLPTLRRHDRASDWATGAVGGSAKLDRRTKRLVGRVNCGDIAVVDHMDIDRVAADSLVAAGVGAVINAKPSISGRYPNLGPEVLVSAGIVLIDEVGDEIFDRIDDGDKLRIEGGKVFRGEELLAEGRRLDAAAVAAAMAEARQGLAVQLEAFAANTMEYLNKERDLLLDGVGVPEVDTVFADRHCLIVVRGYDYKADLDVLRPYIREFKPVLVGVDGGADALVEAGYTPDLIVGDMDSASDEVLRCGAELVVHAYSDGHAPGMTRLEHLGVAAKVFPASATSEDIAMLLADEKGASMIVAVGTHATLVEFLDKGRSGMASTFLTRLRVGAKLVDAKGVSRLYRQRVPASGSFLLACSAIAGVAAAVALFTAGMSFAETGADWWDGMVSAIQRIFS